MTSLVGSYMCNGQSIWTGWWFGAMRKTACDFVNYMTGGYSVRLGRYHCLALWMAFLSRVAIRQRMRYTSTSPSRVIILDEAYSSHVLSIEIPIENHRQRKTMATVTLYWRRMNLKRECDGNSCPSIRWKRPQLYLLGPYLMKPDVNGHLWGWFTPNDRLWMFNM